MEFSHIFISPSVVRRWGDWHIAMASVAVYHKSYLDTEYQLLIYVSLFCHIAILDLQLIRGVVSTDYHYCAVVPFHLVNCHRAGVYWGCSPSAPMSLQGVS